MNHDWKRQPGNTTVWRCVKCQRYSRAAVQSNLPADGCGAKPMQRKQVSTSKPEFEKLVEQVGRIGIVYRIRRHVIGCWDFSTDDRGVLLLTADYDVIGTYSYEEILDWIR